MATQDVLDAISQAKNSGKGISIDFSKLPGDVDTRQVVGALTQGLPQEHANAINSMAMGGKGVRVDFGKIPGWAPPAGQGGIYQDYPVRRAISKYAIRPALEMGGQALGAAAASPVAGAAAAIPVVGPVAAFGVEKAAAGAGGTAGDVLADKIDQMMGLYHPETMSPEAVKRMRMIQLGTNTAGSVLGSAAGKAASEFAAPYQGEIDQAIKGASERLGVPVTAGGMLKSETPGRMEALFNKLPFMSDVMRKYYQGSRDKMVGILNGLFKGGEAPNPQTAAKLTSQVATDLGDKIDDLARSGITPQLDPADVGIAARRDVLGALKGIAKQAGEPFEAIKKAETGQVIPATNATTQAQQILDEGISHPAIQKVAGMAPEEAQVPPELAATFQNQNITAAEKARLLQQIGGAQEAQGPTMTDLLNARAELSAALTNHTLQGGRSVADDRVGGAMQSLIGAIDKDIAAGAPHVAGDFEKARAGWAAYASLRDNSAIRRIISAEQPEAIVDNLVRPEMKTNLGKALQLMSPETRDQVQNTFINRAIRESTDMDGKFVPAKLARFINNYGDETGNLAAGQDGWYNLKRLSQLSGSSFSDPSFRNFVTMLGKRDGANLAPVMLQPNNGANINRLRALIGEKSFGDAHDAALLDLATNNQGNIDFAGLGKRIGDVGDETLLSLFGPKTTAILKDLADVGRGLGRAERVFSNPSGTAQVFGLMAIMFRALNNPLNAIKFIGTLTGTAKAYTSPFVTQWLTEGVAPQATGDVASLLTKYPTSVIGNSLANPYKKGPKK